MHVWKNPHRGTGLPGLPDLPSTDDSAVARLLRECPAAAPTPLIRADDLAARVGVAEVHVKDERGRMGLGSFKALGAAYVIACDAQAARGDGDWASALAGRSYVAASAGNHGLSVAAGARVFGAQAVIYLADTVPEAFAARLRTKGAQVMRAEATYEESMAAAERAAGDSGWQLLSDSSWPGYIDVPRRVMEGYLQLAAELIAEMPEPPDHVLLQAGVGGLAAAVAALIRRDWGDAPVITVVEPDAAPALLESARAGKVVTTEGPISAMGRLDCKTPSLIALAGLARDADLFATVSEAEAQAATDLLAGIGLASTPSGTAGAAALLADPAALGLGADSRVVLILSEGAEAP